MRLRLSRPSHATVVAYLALATAMSGTAAAATGGVFVLGQSNRADRASALVNRSGTPLALHAREGSPPLRVDTETRVRHLNADLLDRLDSTSFLRAGAKAADSDLLDGRSANDFMPALCPNGPTDFVQSLTGCTRVLEVTAPIVQTTAIRVGYSAPGGVAACPQGMYAVGGGYTLAGPADRLDAVRASFPYRWRYQPDTWVVEVVPNALNNGAVNAGSTVHVMCVGPAVALADYKPGT